jgi:hypothetical protein
LGYCEDLGLQDLQINARTTSTCGGLMIDEFRKLLDVIMSEGLAKIEALSDEELRKVVLDEDC